MDGPAGDVDEPLARHDAPEDVDPEGGRRVAATRRSRRVERYPVLEVDVAGAREEGDAVAVAQREVAVAAGEICLGGESVREGHTPDVAMQTLKAICSSGKKNPEKCVLA